MGTNAKRGLMGQFRASDWKRGSDFHDLGIFPSYLKILKPAKVNPWKNKRKHGIQGRTLSTTPFSRGE